MYRQTPEQREEMNAYIWQMNVEECSGKVQTLEALDARVHKLLGYIMALTWAVDDLERELVEGKGEGLCLKIGQPPT